jgi:peptidoglycan-associated lipoprotein
MASGNIIYFDFDKSTIRQDALPVLMAHAEKLKSSGGSAVLEGHADERGTREYNMALGERRGIAVRDYLVSQGVSRAKLEVVSYGEERPAVAESNSQAWSMNRRVVIR